MAGTRSFRWPKPETLLLAAALVSAAAVSFPQLWRMTRGALEIARLPYAERRERVIDMYAALRQLRRQLPESERLAIVTMRPVDFDRGVFANYYLYPRPSRLYEGLEAYRRSLDPPPPTTILRIDGRRLEPIRLMTYAEVRREAMEGRGIVRDSGPSPQPRRAFLVPLVASVDGAPPDSYTTEAVLVADAVGEVTFTLWPSSQKKTFALQPGRPLRLIDLVDQSFGAMTQGWLQVSSTVPVRSAFWFVNRGAGKAAELPAIEQPPPLPMRVAGGERLWVLNASDRAAVVRINGSEVMLQPHALWVGPATPENVVDGDARVFAFASTKRPDGDTLFFWPERAR